MVLHLTKTVEIEPKSCLSASELTAKRHVEVKAPHTGLKRALNEGSAAESEDLNSAYSNLRAQLSVPRIERTSGRAQAVWRVEQQVAEVLRKDGKFECFGYSEQGKHYLEFYEALFLLELGRLQMEFHDVVVSVEQAYLLLLGEVKNEKFDQYLVYSALSRVGYIVVKHQCNVQEASTSSNVTTEDCVWALLQQNVNNKCVPAHIKASPHYGNIKIKMEAIKQHIVNPQSTIDINVSSQSETSFKYDTRKRIQEANIGPINKKSRTTNKDKSSLVGFLKAEREYAKFQELFEKFDIVQLDNTSLSTPKRILDVIFDLHLHNEGFKKSAPQPPSFFVVILNASDIFPTHDEIAYCQQQQLHKAPLLVISVSEYKQIQAFVYYIS